MTPADANLLHAQDVVAFMVALLVGGCWIAVVLGRWALRLIDALIEPPRPGDQWPGY